MKLVDATYDADEWQLVPKKPTEAWQLNLARGDCEWDTGMDVIAAVIAAAPIHPSMRDHVEGK